MYMGSYHCLISWDSLRVIEQEVKISQISDVSHIFFQLKNYSLTP